jgi:hypothetical protein
MHSLSISHSYSAIMDPSMQKAIKEAAEKGYYLFINMSNTTEGEYLREGGGNVPKLIAAKLLHEDPNEIHCQVKISDLVPLIEMRLRPATSVNPLVLQIHIDEIQTSLSEQQLLSIRTPGSILNQMFKDFMEASLHLAKHHIFLVVVTSGSLCLSFKGNVNILYSI